MALNLTLIISIERARCEQRQTLEEVAIHRVSFLQLYYQNASSSAWCILTYLELILQGTPGIEPAP